MSLEKLLTVSDLSEILKLKPSIIRSRLYTHPERLPPSIHVGRYVRWEPEAVKAWMEDQREKQASPLNDTIKTSKIKKKTTQKYSIIPKKKTFTWALPEFLDKHNISARQVAFDLQEQGINISPSQMVRIVNKLPDRLNTEVLLGLVNKFDCPLSDIIRTSKRKKKSTQKYSIFPKKKAFIWALPELLVKHDISVRQLAFDLQKMGIKTSPAHLTRIVNKLPDRLNTEILLGLVNKFACPLEDILRTE